jgi:RNA polymerase sigma factor (sigma-70 family)
MTDASITQRIEELLVRLERKDPRARDELINVTCQRLLVLTRKMLGGFGRLRQWEQSDDVSQNAMLRLRRALDDVTPTTAAEFYGLAAEQIRRELLDLTRYYFGRAGERNAAPSGDKATPGDNPSSPEDPPKVELSDKRPGRAGVMSPLGELRSPDGFQGAGAPDPGQLTHDPHELAAWSEFHQQVAALPAAERQVVDLLWYQDLSQPEAADVLGVDVSTVKRRWRSARLRLHEKLRGWLPKASSRSDQEPGDGQ